MSILVFELHQLICLDQVVAHKPLCPAFNGVFCHGCHARDEAAKSALLSLLVQLAILKQPDSELVADAAYGPDLAQVK